MPDRSPYEQAALNYCAPRGIPLSEFLYVWSDEDRWAALDWQAEQDRRCSGCGQDLEQTLGPGSFDKWNAEVSGHCDGCRALHRAASIDAGKDDLDPTVGVRYRIWRDTDGRVDNTSTAVGETRTAST